MGAPEGGAKGVAGADPLEGPPRRVQGVGVRAAQQPVDVPRQRLRTQGGGPRERLGGGAASGG